MKHILPSIVIIFVVASCSSDNETMTTEWFEITAGITHSCGITTDKTLYCWGSNEYGQFGNGTITDKAVPTKANDAFWLKITTKQHHTCGIKETDNKLYCWGPNYSGQLGDGTTEHKNIPTKIGDDVWSEITAGYDYTCGINNDHDLYCWGDNQYGQLGDGTTIDKIVPTKVGEESWSTIVAGHYHTCGITTDQNLYCWGANYSGELGDGTAGDNANKKIPTKIGGDKWLTISGGLSHTCGIRLDNRLYCWGANGSGQLGDGTTSSKNVPTLMSDDFWSGITAGYYHSCGVTKNNQLYCWGNNAEGQLGDGTIGEAASKRKPIKIGDASWLIVKSGWFHTCGIKTNNKLYCWGYNPDGELGNGTMADKTTPTPVADPL